MKNLKSLSDTQLASNLQNLVREERRITLEILHHLREVERRKLFAERGYPSLFEYCVKELGYSESAAFRRISTMRALKETPELEEAVQSGRLSVTTVSRVQTFFRAEKIQNQKSYDSSEKRLLFSSLEGKSSREVERELLKLSPESAVMQQRERLLDASRTEIRFVADGSLLEKLRACRDLAAHQLEDPNSYAELLSILADAFLKKRNARQEKTVAAPEVKQVKAEGEVKADSEVRGMPAVNVNAVIQPPHSRYIPPKIRRQVWQKSRGRCTYQDPRTKRVCGTTFKLQIDHRMPFVLGGSSRDPENLRLLCATHNQLMGERVFGSFRSAGCAEEAVLPG